MKDIDISSMSSMINLTKQIFTIIKKDYSKYLSNEKKEFCDNFTETTLAVINNQDKLPIYFENDKIYLNEYYQDINFSELLILISLISLTGELNPLKLGLILIESKIISDNYNLPLIDVFKLKEYEIGNLIKDKIIDDLGFNIIFMDSEIEIFHYLTEEKGIRIAKLYYELSKRISSKFNQYDFSKFNLSEFLNYYQNIDYQDIYDYIYDFISINIK